MSEERFDAIVIGTGQAGPPLAVRLASLGRKTAILERKRFGGTCVNVGCIPTKTLVASARAAHVARNAAAFGVTIDGAVNVDMPRVKARKDAIVAESTGNVERWLRGTPNLTVIEGQGRFEAPHMVSVGERRLTAPEIFINTGCRPTPDTRYGFDQCPWLRVAASAFTKPKPVKLLMGDFGNASTGALNVWPLSNVTITFMPRNRSGSSWTDP